ncbi:hypothetical protein EDD17DRAFT_1874348 [Pisolithus thermaeus]|nr:hypothetical protein EDD17DRAFT_1874348 [Pisolithus thermaeus]
MPALPVGEPFVVTSPISRAAAYFMWLDFSTNLSQSSALDIIRRVTELMFQEKVGHSWSKRAEVAAAHNCLVDCCSEVWTCFPVLAAVQRETISPASLRSQKRLIFVMDRDFQMFAQHFSDMIYAFERTSKKPTGDVLRSIKVSTVMLSVFVQELCGTMPWNVSQYRAGEWIVDFLCLIPIHIAVMRDNRFIPLKDGVYSPELESSLSGAKVNRIIDSISFGWYESLFRSYMATKPVRVVSSMGEQSVGKSYALNHLVDTSFVGSAMRTTEGVWMSTMPTEKELIIALDFEVLNGLPRRILFNTAISNLLLFCSNFVLSRDIAGLFQSFQSSATVLDPAANPSLLQSTLVIIIKDVLEADRTEIARDCNDLCKMNKKQTLHADYSGFVSDDDECSSPSESELVIDYNNADQHPGYPFDILESFRFTISDNPGLIAGTSSNVGLGHSFLRSLERSHALVYAVDLAGEAPWDELRALRDEVEVYLPGMSDKAQLVVANKADLLVPEGSHNDKEAVEKQKPN